MSRTFAVVVALHISFPGGPWFGADKIKHFLMSAFVHSTTYSAARWAGATRPMAHGGAAIATAAVGVWKEVHDRRAGRPFSVSDLVWDAAGGVSAAALLNQSR